MNKCLFLDRDGVINRDVGYAGQPQDIEFIPGIFQLCQTAADQGYLLIIITNQSGIARGYYSEQDFAALCRWFEQQFTEQGVVITATYHCPHHPDITGPCDCRKPAPGMLHRAISEHRIEPLQSLMLGDKASDMQAAEQAGISQRLLLSEKSTTAAPATGIIRTVAQAIRYL